MARGKTLTSLLTDLRAECRQSLNPAQNNQMRELDVHLLQRTQERLWDDNYWPHLRVERQIPLQAGQRFYDPPDMAIDRIEKISVKWGEQWVELRPDITDRDYDMWDPDLDERSWPVEAWKIWEDEQVEVWPLPGLNADEDSREGYLKFVGIRSLRPLVADSDRADLDNRLIVLYAAAERLAAAGAQDASMKLDMANRRLKTLRAHLTPRRSFRLFGGGDDRCPRQLKGPPRVSYRNRTEG